MSLDNFIVNVIYAKIILKLKKSVNSSIIKLVNTKIISNRELKNLIHNSIGKAIINKNKKNNLFFISENEIIDINNKKTNIGFI